MKRSKIRMILYILKAWLPISRIQFDRYNLKLLDIMAAQREMQMMNRQDILALANRMLTFHSKEMNSEKGKTGINNMQPIKKDIDNTENMFG